MHAVRTYGPGDLRVEDVPEPQVDEATDAIVKVTASAICGSDLHLYHGKIPGIEAGMVCGHEFAGEVVEVGSGVLDIAAGERCVASMFSACGGEAFLRGLSITGLVGEPLRYRADLLRLIGARRLDPARIISHTLPLTEAVEAYRMFDAREATKIVLHP